MIYHGSDLTSTAVDDKGIVYSLITNCSGSFNLNLKFSILEEIVWLMTLLISTKLADEDINIFAVKCPLHLAYNK